MDGLRKHFVSIKRGYNPSDCGTTCIYGILLAILGFLQIICFKGKKKKKSLLFPHTSYILFPFIHFKSHCQTPENSFKAISFQKIIGTLKREKKKAAVFLARQTTQFLFTHVLQARLGTHKHIPSCAWVYHLPWKPIYSVAMSSTV